MTKPQYRLFNKLIILMFIGICITMNYLVADAQSESNQIFLPTVIGGGEAGVSEQVNAPSTDSWVQAAMTGGAIVGYGNNCLDIPGQNTANGTDLNMWDCNGTVAQQWTLTSDGRITAMGKCLDVEGPAGGNGIDVQIWDCLNVAQHFWTVTSAGQIRSYDGRCLDVRGWGTANGTAVQLWNCVSPAIPAQRWSIQSPPSDGRGVIVIDPGHGYYRNNDGSWVTNRPIIEHDGVSYLEGNGTVEFAAILSSLLRQKGYEVYSTRELDKSAGIGISGRPAWQEASRYYLQSQGVSSSIWDNGRTSCPSTFPNSSEACQDLYGRAFYANSLSADLLLSIHSNGGGGTGTETFHYPNSQQGEQLASAIHTDVIAAARGVYPNWRDRTVKSGRFTILSTTSMPAALIEIAFHDTRTPDWEALTSASFQQRIATAMCNGILEYFDDNRRC